MSISLGMATYCVVEIDLGVIYAVYALSFQPCSGPSLSGKGQEKWAPVH